MATTTLSPKVGTPLRAARNVPWSMSCHDAHREVKRGNLKGPSRAALECRVRHLALELGRQGTRPDKVPPCPKRTRAARSIADLDELVDAASRGAAASAGIEDHGRATAMRAVQSPLPIPGSTIFVDGGAPNMN